MAWFIIFLLVFFIPIFKLFPESRDAGKAITDAITTQATFTSVLVINEAPIIDSITTYPMYNDYNDNKPETNFTICTNEESKKVYLQIDASDLNSFEDITDDGNVTFIIVLFDRTTESNFERIGTE